MAIIKLNHLDSQKTQALQQLTNQEMVATVGGNDVLETIGGVAQIGLGVYNTINPPPTPERQPTGLEQAVSISQGITNSGNATANQGLVTGLQIAGLIPTT